MNKNKRKVEIVVLSDIHLGTYGCQATAVKKYLKSIQPEKLILNGDIMDIWQFKKRYWPKSHMKVVKQIVSLAAEGVKTYYITGNHDEILRKFAGMKLGSFHIVNDLKIDLPDGKAWFFHGDVFDVIIQNSKWLARLGAIGYDALILINIFLNALMKIFGRKKISMSKKIKNNVKSALKYIDNFEETAAIAGQKKGYKYVVCGHIHKAQKRIIEFETGSITYLNSGDWIENLSALEYNDGKWEIYEYNKDEKMNMENSEDLEKELTLVDLSANSLLKNILEEFKV